MINAVLLRPKNGVGEGLQPSDFEVELMVFDENEVTDEAILVDESDVVTADISMTLPRTWLRPPILPFDAAKEKLVFQQMDIDFYKVNLVWMHSLDTSCVRLHEINSFQFLMHFRVQSSQLCPVQITVQYRSSVFTEYRRMGTAFWLIFTDSCRTFMLLRRNISCKNIF